jgi:hypothetical protein
MGNPFREIQSIAFFQPVGFVIGTKLDPTGGAQHAVTVGMIVRGVTGRRRIGPGTTGPPCVTQGIHQFLGNLIDAVRPILNLLDWLRERVHA